MSPAPLVSVVIPSYNHARFLPGAVESVLVQTYPNLECLIFDDGSTDGSWEVALAYQDGDERVRLLSHDGRANRGIASTLNAAHAQAHGDYVTSLAADDLLVADSLERRVRALGGEPQPDLVYGRIEMLDASGVPTGQHGGISLEAIRTFDATDDLLEALLLHCFVTSPTALVRRALFDRVGGYSGAVYYTDWELWIKLLARGALPAFVGDAPLAACRPGAYGDEADLPRRLELFRSLDAQAATVGGRLQEPRIRALVCLQLALHAAQLGDEREAAAKLASAFQRDPSLRDDSDYMAWWLLPLQRRRLPGAGPAATGAWLRQISGSPSAPTRAISAGARAGHFGCWTVETASTELSPEACDRVLWAVISNELELQGSQPRPRILIACLVLALQEAQLRRDRWFAKACLCAAGVWPFAARVRRLASRRAQ